MQYRILKETINWQGKIKSEVTTWNDTFKLNSDTLILNVIEEGKLDIKKVKMPKVDSYAIERQMNESQTSKHVFERNNTISCIVGEFYPSLGIQFVLEDRGHKLGSGKWIRTDIDLLDDRAARKKCLDAQADKEEIEED